MNLPHFNGLPGFVVSYDAPTRHCRVRVPGVTDGAETFPEAMLCNPIGDKSEHTDIRILAGDRVWVAFVNGDARYPVIVGFRPKETDAAIDVRRLHHKAIELIADTNMLLEATATQVTIKAGTKVLVQAPDITLTGAITLDGNTVCTGTLAVNQMLTYLSGVTGTGTATSNGKDVSSTHRHGGVSGGLSNTAPPI